ncbi:hypothetical protein [Streptomyces sp. NPDC005303]
MSRSEGSGETDGVLGEAEPVADDRLAVIVGEGYVFLPQIFGP